MNRGELVFTKTFKAEFSSTTIRGSATMKVPPGQVMILIHMGSCLAENMNKIEADGLLEDMGWTAPVEEQHADDLAIDRFAVAMKEKMAEMRAKGKRGWDDPARCTVGHLQQLLHVCREPVDIGNYAMMIFNRTKDQP